MTTPPEALFAAIRAATASNDHVAAMNLIRDVAVNRSEREWVDWKQTDGLDSTSQQLTESDKKNLARLLSAFSNSFGGIIAWGFTDSAETRPFSMPETFERKLLEQCGNLTLPSVIGVDAVTVFSKPDRTEGVVVFFVPRSLGAPHQVWANVADKGRYFTRSGSECKVLDSFSIEDLLGRRPGPLLSLEMAPEANWFYVLDARSAPRGGPTTVRIDFRLKLKNAGSLTAREVYGSVRVPLDQNRLKTNLCEFRNVHFNANCNGSSFGELREEVAKTRKLDFVSKHNVPPGMAIDGFMQVRFEFEYGPLHNLIARQGLAMAIAQSNLPSIEWTAGADGARLEQVAFAWDTEVLSRMLPDQPKQIIRD